MSNQALDQLLAEKHALQSKLRALIAAEVGAFTERTGAGISSVDVRMVSQHFIEKPADYIVSGVTVSIPLD